MKLSDIKIGVVVYIKKSCSYLGDPTIPQKVVYIEERKNKHNRVILEFSRKKFNAGELTDKSCAIMTCENCKYHRKDKE